MSVEIRIKLEGGIVEALENVQKATSEIQTKLGVQETCEAKFRSDMDIKKAIEDLTEEYLEEAKRRCGDGHGSQTAMSKLLGFQSYQAFSYWEKRHRSKRGKQ